MEFKNISAILAMLIQSQHMLLKYSSVNLKIEKLIKKYMNNNSETIVENVNDWMFLKI